MRRRGKGGRSTLPLLDASNNRDFVRKWGRRSARSTIRTEIAAPLVSVSAATGPRGRVMPTGNARGSPAAERYDYSEL